MLWDTHHDENTVETIPALPRRTDLVACANVCLTVSNAAVRAGLIFISGGTHANMTLTIPSLDGFCTSGGARAEGSVTYVIRNNICVSALLPTLPSVLIVNGTILHFRFDHFVKSLPYTRSRGEFLMTRSAVLILGLNCGYRLPSITFPNS